MLQRLARANNVSCGEIFVSHSTKDSQQIKRQSHSFPYQQPSKSIMLQRISPFWIFIFFNVCYSSQVVTQARQGQSYDSPVGEYSTNLYPRVQKDGHTSSCYVYVNPAVGTCRRRRCQTSFVCTSRQMASHYCFAKIKKVSRLIPDHAGCCIVRQQKQSFRTPYADIRRKVAQKRNLLNYNTLMRNDVRRLEPASCFL